MSKKTILTKRALLLSSLTIVLVLAIPGYILISKLLPTVKPVTYQDVKKNFKVTIPSNWKTSETTATSTTQLDTPQAETQLIAITTMSSPDGLYVTIQVYPGQPDCPFANPITGSIAGLPAAFDASHTNWTIPTTTATYTINYSYPGIGVYHKPLYLGGTPSVRTLHSADFYEKELASLINSFIPASTHPFTCN